MMAASVPSDQSIPLQDHKGAASSGTDIPDHYEPGQEGMIKYNMYYTMSRTNVQLHEGLATTPPVYFAESESFTTKPFFFLRKGGSKKSPMVAFVKFRMTSRHMLVGKGDVKKQIENDLVWEKLEREKGLLSRSDYRITTSEGSATGERVEYTWRKNKSKTFATVYDCVDPNGRVVSNLLSGGMFNWKKGGELEVLGSLDEGLREFLIASAFGIWTMEAFDYQSLISGFGKDQKKE